MLRDQHITIIGPGVMGEAILSCLLRDHAIPAENILIAGPRADRGKQLQDKYGVRYTADNRGATAEASLVILAVKPQRFAQVAANLDGCLRMDSLVISIVAGVPIQKIMDSIHHPAVIRAMPNTPSQIGKGIAVWASSPKSTPHQIDLARAVFQTLGSEIFVEDESYLDMATALSGTGPAYVFLFMEALIDAGVHLGFPRRIAEQLVVQTLRGSTEFYLVNAEHPARLRNQVTSPGGTSAEALYYLEKAGFRTALSRAIWAAYERSQQLGKELQHKPDVNGS